jgi:nitrogen fixation-related uncharacterized protein
MSDGAIALLAASIGIFAIFVGLFVWGLRTGQFKNIEEPKYKMLENVYKNSIDIETDNDPAGKKEEGDDKNA